MKITTTATTISVEAPYNAAFVSAAKRLGGKWSAPKWVFDIRNEQRVRAACMEHYGTDGLQPMDAVTLRIVFRPNHYEDRGAITVGGREVARAFNRDSGAKLADGIVVLDGGFTSGGSMKNWETRVRSAGATVLMRDVPRVLADRLIADGESGVESIAIEPEAPVIDRDALSEERKRLLDRIAQIDALLGDVA